MLFKIIKADDKMKKNRVSLAAVAAIVFALSSAFVTRIKADEAAKQSPSYYWFTPAGVYEALNTTTAEQSRTGCTFAASVCENAYTSSQLNNPSQPSQGVKSGQTPQVIIHKNS